MYLDTVTYVPEDIVKVDRASYGREPGGARADSRPRPGKFAWTLRSHEMRGRRSKMGVPLKQVCTAKYHRT